MRGADPGRLDSGGAVWFCDFGRVRPACGVRRLDQWISNLGYCSRRQAPGWIAEHRVTIAGAPAVDGAQKAAAADVLVDGEPLDHPGGILVALHKPAGLVCTRDPGEGPNVYSLFPAQWVRRNPALTTIGRLDKETSGLLLLTDQTALVHRLTSPRHKVPKVYRAGLDAPPGPDVLAAFASGTLMLTGEDRPCAPADVRVTGEREAEVTLTEGRYHQVRRMFAACGLTVLTLHRTHFGRLALTGLTAGSWRELPLDYFEHPEPQSEPPTAGAARAS